MLPLKARIFYKTPLSNHRCPAICYFLKCLEHLNTQRMLGTLHTDAAASLIVGVFLIISFQCNYEYHPRKYPYPCCHKDLDKNLLIRP